MSGNEADAMSRERLSLFDTTLRDGAQTAGVDFSLEDKRLVAGLLLMAVLGASLASIAAGAWYRMRSRKHG